MEIINNKNVAVFRTSATEYPKVKPYHPSDTYPEIAYSVLSDEINSTFEAVRSTIALLEMDKANFGKSCWNPFGSFIHPGNTVLVKPNLVSHFNWGYKSGLTDTESLFTHGSVIRAVIDYVIIALEGNGKIIIGDSPVQISSWDVLMEMIGYKEMKLFFESTYPRISIISSDFRLSHARRNSFGNILQYAGQEGSTNYIEADLGKLSLLTEITNPHTLFGVVDYPKKRLSETHNVTCHKYLFAKLALEADVLINLPKLKTHSKAGFSCSLKNLVGLIGHKDYLPHFRFGNRNEEGDEYPKKGAFFKIINDIAHLEWDTNSVILKGVLGALLKILKLIYLLFSGNTKEIFNIAGGGWHGNDTLWRTILDINRAFFYSGHNHTINKANSITRKYFTLVDGIVGGEKLSPLLPSPVRSGLMIAGFNPVCVDTVSAALIGFDYRKIPLLERALRMVDLPLVDFTPEEILVHSNKPFRTLEDIVTGFDLEMFEPSPGYKGHIEN